MRKLFLLALSLINLTFLVPGGHAQGEQININLGYIPELSSPYSEGEIIWNKLSTWGTTSAFALYDSENNKTSVTWETRQKFVGYSTADGLKDSIYGYPDRVAQTNFYLQNSEVAQVVISGLDANKVYEFTLYGSVRAVAVTRGMSITLSGDGDAATQTLSLQGTSSKPDEAEVIFNNIKPDANGMVIIDFKVAPGYDRGVVSAMTIHSIPEASSVALAFSGGIGFFLLRKLF